VEDGALQPSESGGDSGEPAASEETSPVAANADGTGWKMSEHQSVIILRPLHERV